MPDHPTNRQPKGPRQPPAPLTAMLVAALILTPASLAAAGPFDTTWSCSIPNAVSCRVTDPDGVRLVVVRGEGGLTLVSKSFPCSRKVTVSWDSAFHSSSTLVVDCRGHVVRRPH